MKALRRLALTSLAIAYLQIVFGAVVRITGSGMGCGDHWPTCLGHWVPPMNRPDLIIEVTHRYLALLLGVAIVALLVAAWTRRGRQAGVTGPGGVLRPVLLALGLYVLIANLGRVIVQLGLHPWVIAAHLVLAMALLATLAMALIRAGGFGALAADRMKIAPGTRRAAYGAAGLAILVVAMGALTANLPGVAGACLGFPFCTQAYVPTNGAAHVQLTHRALAFLLTLHLVGMTMAMRKRGEVGAVTTAVRVALVVVLVQIVLAAALVTMGLPKGLQSLHQAVGTLVWLAVFVLAAMARRAELRAPAPADVPAPDVSARSDDPRAGRVRAPKKTPVRAQQTVPATAAQATVAFVATTGPNARMVRVDPNDDAGFAAAEAGGTFEEVPPPDEPMPDVPALAETGSWSLADLSVGMPPNADEHLGEDAEGPDDDDENDDGPDDRRKPGDGHGGGPSAFAAPLIAAAMMASSSEALAQGAESHESVVPHDTVSVVTPTSSPAVAAYTVRDSAMSTTEVTQVTEVTEVTEATGATEATETHQEEPLSPQRGSLAALGMTPRRPPSLAVIIARGAMS